MSFFKGLFKDLFSSEEFSAESDHSDLLSENIVYSDLYWADFEKWKERGILESMLSHLHDTWLLKQKGNDSKLNFYLHESSLSNGFYVKAEDPWDDQDYSFLIQYWIQTLKSKGYVLKRAQREHCEEGGLLKGLEEFYLKPSLKFRRQLPYEQFFGNIHIQHRSVNGKSKLVKLLANSYSDRNYKLAYDFEDLIHFIFVL